MQAFSGKIFSFFRMSNLPEGPAHNLSCCLSTNWHPLHNTYDTLFGKSMLTGHFQYKNYNTFMTVAFCLNRYTIAQDPSIMLIKNVKEKSGVFTGSPAL